MTALAAAEEALGQHAEAMLKHERDKGAAEILRRLIALHVHGYQSEWHNIAGATEYGIALKSISGGPELCFFGDGRIMSGAYKVPINDTPGETSDMIFNETEADIQTFDRFVKTLKKPNWWQKGAHWREKWIGVPIGLAILFGFGWLVSKGVTALWHGIFGP